jgi:hypothetical protein
MHYKPKILKERDMFSNFEVRVMREDIYEIIRKNMHDYDISLIQYGIKALISILKIAVFETRC